MAEEAAVGLEARVGGGRQGGGSVGEVAEYGITYWVSDPFGQMRLKRDRM